MRISDWSSDVCSSDLTFAAGVGNGANQMTILVATADAAAIFNLTADLAMTAALAPAGGQVSWEGSTPDDCVAWGNYTGSSIGSAERRVVKGCVGSFSLRCAPYP